MTKKKLIIILMLFQVIFATNIWLTIDQSQQNKVSKLMNNFFPDAQITYFYWENGLHEILTKIKKKKVPDILLTGHTYIPFIAYHYKAGPLTEPLFWDVRALYIQKDTKSTNTSNWSELINYIQNHNNFISFPNNWTADNFYNFLPFFNDQLPFWVNQSPFSALNMMYTTKLLSKLKQNFPNLFTDNPNEAFLSRKTKAIISGLWMYNLLEKRGIEFYVNPVPESRNGVKAFKGAYAAVFFNKKSKSLVSVLKSYDFQKNAWKIFSLLPTNKILLEELKLNPKLKKLIQINKESRWASSIDPSLLQDRLDSLNKLLNDKKNTEYSNQKLLKHFDNIFIE